MSGRDEHGVDLAESYAYSDSVYDTPLLAAVGHPVVVNPDPRMVFMAAARRWPTIDLDVSPGVRRRCRCSVSSCRRSAMPFARPSTGAVSPTSRSAAREHPRRGRPVILVGEPSFVLRPDGDRDGRRPKAGRTVRFLGKKEVFDVPLVGSLATAMGGIRVDRGTGSDEPLQAAAEALEGGEMVGDHARGDDPARAGVLRPELKGRWGAARLAADDRGRRSSPSACGGPSRCGRARRGCPTCFNIADAADGDRQRGRRPSS